MVEQHSERVTLVTWNDTYILSSEINSVHDLLGISPLLEYLSFGDMSEELDVTLYDLEYDTEAATEEELRDDLALIANNTSQLLQENALTVLNQRIVTFPTIEEELPVDIGKRKLAIIKAYSEMTI